MDRVDAHVHVFAPASDAYPREISELFPPTRSGNVEVLLREMDAAGIGRAVLIQLGGYGIAHHRYVAEALRMWPDRLAGVGLVDLSDHDPPARLEELQAEAGITGIRLMGQLGDHQATAVDELPAYKLFQRAGDLGLNINLYCPSNQISNIEMVVRSLPSVQFGLDHLGICPSTPVTVDRWLRPRFSEEPIPPNGYPQVLALSRYPNVHVKVSGEYAFSKLPYPFSDMRPMVEQAYQAFGAERLMWCSDFPWICDEPGYARLTEMIDRHLPDSSRRERAAMMGGNAERIWFAGR